MTPEKGIILVGDGRRARAMKNDAADRMPVAIMFDGDETLISTGGAGTRSWRYAFDRLHWIPAETFLGGALFLGLYAVFMLGLIWFAPGYIEQVWNLRVLSGVLIYGISLEELLFGAAFGRYWSGGV